jgi:hypothetical protein
MLSKRHLNAQINLYLSFKRSLSIHSGRLNTGVYILENAPPHPGENQPTSVRGKIKGEEKKGKMQVTQEER